MELKELLWECFRYFYHLDQHNSAVHCSPVRYSPITFRLAERISSNYSSIEVEVPSAIAQVLSHRGTYPEDKGRLELESHD